MSKAFKIKSKFDNTKFRKLTKQKPICKSPAGKRATAQPVPELAFSDDILGEFAKHIASHGLVREVGNSKAIYLTISSRVLRSPISVVIKGDSSVGKSSLLDRILKYFPKRAFLEITGASDKALLYSEDTFVNRVLIFAEKHGLSSDLLNYYVRELLSRGYIEHLTVRPGTGGHKTHKIVKPGPTGFITTTTGDLHSENETRMLALQADDSNSTTAEVMGAIAREYNGKGKPTHLSPPKRWQDFQRWFAKQSTEVIIPFSEAISDLIPPTTPRLRRAFGLVMGLVSVHALLHRMTRGSRKDCVIAQFKDYRAVRALVERVLADNLEQSVPPTIRETVEAVAAITKSHITLDDLAAKLGINKSNASRRFRKAEDAGYLMNRGMGPTFAIALANPMPSDGKMLPTVKEVRSRFAERKRSE